MLPRRKQQKSGPDISLFLCSWRVGANIYGVEVKKEEHIRSRSLGVFREQEKPTGAIRFSLKNFGFKNGMWSVPLYVALCLPAGL